MKTTRVVLVIFLTYISTFSYAQSCNSIRSVQWLLGYWVADDGKNITIESWEKVSPLTFEGFGESRTKTSNELQTSESLRLIEMANELFYLAKPEQNDRPVAFKLTHCSSKSVVFENSAHDFPKKLEYRLGVEDKLTVIVSGEKDKGFNINMEKKHKNKLVAEFTKMLDHTPIHVLDIPDEYKYMDPELVNELEARVNVHLIE